MTAAMKAGNPAFIQTGAPLNLYEPGGQFVWQTLEKQVKHLQTRIAKSTREGRRNKVKPCNVY